MIFPQISWKTSSVEWSPASVAPTHTEAGGKDLARTITTKRTCTTSIDGLVFVSFAISFCCMILTSTININYCMVYFTVLAWDLPRSLDIVSERGIRSPLYCVNREWFRHT